MVNSSELGNMPQIGGNQISISSIKSNKKPDISMFDSAPCDVTIGSFFGKILIGVIIGLCVAALLFGAISAIGGTTASEDGSNGMLGILLPIVGFIVAFVGNLALALLYNIFFSKKYYDFGKMFGLIFMSSIIIFVFFFLIYLLFQGNSSILYLIFGLQLIFSLFISLNLIDFLAQPNYSASSLMGNTLGSVLALCVYLALAKNMIMSAEPNTLLFLVGTAIIAYAITIFGASIWDGIYYKFYEWGNNPFYLPSLNELRENRKKQEVEKQKEEEEVNVEIK